VYLVSIDQSGAIEVRLGAINEPVKQHDLTSAFAELLKSSCQRIVASIQASKVSIDQRQGKKD
jgi:hypothetical protein